MIPCQFEKSKNQVCITIEQTEVLAGSFPSGQETASECPLSCIRMESEMFSYKSRRTRTEKMKSKKDIVREYKERKKLAGVFQVKNTVNGKMLLGSSLNLEGPLNGHKFMLTVGSHRNKVLQKEWNEYGPDKFVFEILEIVKVKEDPHFNLSDELELLEQIWLEKLQPFGEKGYNTSTKIRQA